MAFFTPFITGAIDFRYGYVFAGCCAAATVTVFFFLPESQGKTLEEVDFMYRAKVKPWKSHGYRPGIGNVDDDVSSEEGIKKDGGVEHIA